MTSGSTTVETNGLNQTLASSLNEFNISYTLTPMYPPSKIVQRYNRRVPDADWASHALYKSNIAEALKSTLAFPASARHREQTKEGFFYQNEWITGMFKCLINIRHTLSYRRVLCRSSLEETMCCPCFSVLSSLGFDCNHDVLQLWVLRLPAEYLPNLFQL